MRNIIDGMAVTLAYMLGSVGVNIGPFILMVVIWAFLSATVEAYEGSK
jgi:hypothetical protein